MRCEKWNEQGKRMRESLAAVNGAAVQSGLNVISLELFMHAC